MEGQEVVVTVSDRVAESEVRSVIEASKKKVCSCGCRCPSVGRLTCGQILNVKVEQESAAGR